MRIIQIITDYIRRSVLTTEGDMIIRGASGPEREAGPDVNKWLRGRGAGNKPQWTADLGGAAIQGDLITRGASTCTRIAAVAAGQVLKSAGVNLKPVWGVDRAELTNQGDMTVRGASIAERLAAVAIGKVLTSKGVNTKPAWENPTNIRPHIGMGNFAMTATGDHVVSSLAFQPVVVIFFAIDARDGVDNNSWGFSDGTSARCVYRGDNGSYSNLSVSHCVYIRCASDNYIVSGAITLAGDGFTASFTEVGSCEMKSVWLAIG